MRNLERNIQRDPRSLDGLRTSASSPGTRTIEDIISEHQKLAKLAMETTDAFRARFAENYYQLLLKKGVDPATARARATAKAAALPARIETRAAAPALAPAAPPTPVAAPPAPPALAPAPAIKREAPSSDESEDDGTSPTTTRFLWPPDQ